MYVGNEGVKRNIKLEEQNSEIIKWKVLLDWSRLEYLRWLSLSRLVRREL